VGYSPEYPVGNPACLLQKEAMDSFSLSCMDVDKDDWRVKSREQLANWFTHK